MLSLEVNVGLNAAVLSNLNVSRIIMYDTNLKEEWLYTVNRIGNMVKFQYIFITDSENL